MVVTPGLAYVVLQYAVRCAPGWADKAAGKPAG